MILVINFWYFLLGIYLFYKYILSIGWGIGGNNLEIFLVFNEVVF